MNWRARNNISADLDIFGSSTAEDAGQVNADFDIFGDEPENKEDISDEDKKTIDNLFGEGNESTESTDVETTDDKSVEETTDETADTTDDGTATDKTSTEETEELAPDIENLLEEIKDSTDNDEKDTLVEQLRSKLIESETSLMLAQKQNQVLNERLLEQTGSSSEYEIARPVLDKINANPKLKAVIRLAWANDDIQKQKLADILSSLLYDVTGEDVSELIENSMKSKIQGALGTGSNSNASIKEEEEEKPMDFEESVTRLF